MPTVLKFLAYRLFFYSNEGDEPPHVHVERDGCTAKFWIRPVALAHSRRFSSVELNRLSDVVKLHEAQIEEAWHEHFDT
ncbi:DUF4160 domain-containing protein [Leucobacter sp. wl10]|uniref:DUF4160 domain-containing protein n=1 Tax=Leucobacter sp. wl10 TaxID=2304677 RepID=UPI000E5B7119|nr:DUF4160 domain-containing protein [Leucobacter sp. wl10]RGE17660.1 DUF4160 domain-containing protein [Leucobacter sp. wl10]